MSKKTLNTDNLAALGAKKLADLLIEVSTGSADIKRRLRLELSHNLGASELVHAIRKRLVTLRKSNSFVGWRKRKALIKDIDTQVVMIVEKIAPEDPSSAFELLWQFIEIAPSIYERVDDSRGDVGDVFRSAILHFEAIAPLALLSVEALAAQVWNVIQDNGYGEWDGIIGILSDTLGASGLDQLRQHVEDFAAQPIDVEAEQHDAILFLRELRGGHADYAAERKERFVQSCLQEIAAAAGDTHAYVAQYTPDDLRRKDVAAEVALLFIKEGRTDDALTLLDDVEQDGRDFGQEAWNHSYLATLEALGRTKDAQAHRWSCFIKTLDQPHLRTYIKGLPDFEDVEAEEKARAHVLDYPSFSTALSFFLEWPDLLSAAQLIENRSDEIDGNRYDILTPAAEALRERHPLPAVLLWRAMIDYSLGEGRSSRYGHAADHLMDCSALEDAIQDYGTFQSHADYFQTLRMAHDRKTSFWAKLK